MTTPTSTLPYVSLQCLFPPRNCIGKRQRASTVSRLLLFAACINAQISHAGDSSRKDYDVFVIPDITEGTTQKRAKGTNEKKWLFDSGAAVHVTHDHGAFIAGTFRCAPGKGIRVANGKRVSAKGIGDVRISLPGAPSIVLKDVLYVPECKSNIISTKRLWYSHGIKSTFGEG